MKIAVAGKGGVGKTSLVALLAHLYTREQKKVTVIDADPSMNLAYSLGLPKELSEKIIPLSDMKELIEERTRADSRGGLIVLNPEVDDLAEKIAVTWNGISLVVMGTIERGGSGCACPINSLLKAFLNHVFLSRQDVLIADMPAGVEHLGRATAKAVDGMVLVVEPSRQSIDVALHIRSLADDIGLVKIRVVGNKIQDKDDESFIQRHFQETDIAGFIPLADEFRIISQGRASWNCLPPEVLNAVLDIKLKL